MDLFDSEYLLFFKCAIKCNLRYLIIGGYAVNYYGYVRNTHDLDIWLAPTNKNRDAFIETLLCMKYSESEVEPLRSENFTEHYIGTIGTVNSSLDFITIVHHNISFNNAEKDKISFSVKKDVVINFVPYNFLIDMKLLARREKDMLDISELNKLRKMGRQ